MYTGGPPVYIRKSLSLKSLFLKSTETSASFYTHIHHIVNINFLTSMYCMTFTRYDLRAGGHLIKTIFNIFPISLYTLAFIYRLYSHYNSKSAHPSKPSNAFSTYLYLSIHLFVTGASADRFHLWRGQSRGQRKTEDQVRRNKQFIQKQFLAQLSLAILQWKSVF
jgi:hypothetical protein